MFELLCIAALVFQLRSRSGGGGLLAWRSNDDLLSRKKTTGRDNPRQKSASPDCGLLYGGMYAVKHVAWPAWLGEFEHRSVFKTQPIPGGHLLHVQAAHRQVFAHDAWTYWVPFISKHLEQFNVLNGHSPVRPAMFFVVVSVTHESGLFNLCLRNGLLRNTARRNAYRQQTRRFEPSFSLIH